MTHPFDSIDQTSCTASTSRDKAARTLTSRLHADIIARIEAGALLVGERLPSVRTMSAQQAVSRDTVLRAYDRLVAEKRVKAVRGAGYFVVGRRSPAIDPPPVDPRDPLDPMRLLHSDYPLDHQPGSGILRHAASARAELARVLRGVSRSGPGVDGVYGDTLGYLPLRQHLGDWLRDSGVDCPNDAIVTTPGSVSGIGLAVRSLLRAGSMALVEDPCSFMHRHCLMAQGVEIRSVPRLADGPDIDVLRELCELYRPKLFVLSSVLHNPTGSTIALHKAQKLVEIAAEFEMVLIDDCSYIDLLPPTVDRPVVPLILLDRLRWVIHVGGFSRTVSPAAGPGHLVAGEAHMRYIRAYRPVMGLGNMILGERTVYRLLGEGLYRRRCSRIQASLADQKTAVRQRLASVGLTPPENQPGMFLWLSLGDGIDANAVAGRMMARRFLAAPAKHFTTAPDMQSYMRVNVTTTTDAAITLLSSCL